MGATWNLSHDYDDQTQFIADGIKNLRQVKPQVDQLLCNLSQIGELILVGGAVRDLSENKTPRDYDIIIDSCDTEIGSALSDHEYTLNRFGGYKLYVDNIELDIWSIKHNWAFREQLLEPSFENVSKGAFFNFDGLCFHLKLQKLENAAYVESINNKLLDILLDDTAARMNPTPEINIVRALIINKTRGLSLSDRLTKYIYDWFTSTDNHWDRLMKAERKHYGNKNFFTKSDYKKIINNLIEKVSYKY